MAWYDESVFYHIYPLGLLDAPKTNDYKEVTHRLKNLTPWIEHISKIGCNAIYIGPLFESVGHGYETTDYRKLDTRLGDNEDLKNFVSLCHEKNIRVIFDGVFNHTGRDFFAFKDLKENRENSRYKDWYCNVNFYGNNEYNDEFSYDNWGGYNLLVKLNQRNPEVCNYICDTIRFWVKEFDVDGIRLDAADVLDFDFMKQLRKTADEVKPDFWLMGEVIHGDYTRWVNGETLHSVTNYVMHKALYSGHNDHNYFEIAHTQRRLNDMSGNNINGFKLYNFSDNHDVERIVTKLNNKANYVPVHILVYTLPGIPSIYYGSELGIEGKKEKGSDASLRPYINPEDYKDALDNNSYTKIIARLGAIRQANAVLSYGNFEEKHLTNRQYVFTRNTADKTAIIAVNNDEVNATINAGGIRDGEYTEAISGKKTKVTNGNFSTTLLANSGEIWILDASCDVEPVKLENFNENKIQAPVEKITEKVTENVVEAVVANKSEEKEISKPADTKADNTGNIKASTKYNISTDYDKYDLEKIKASTNYDSMEVMELQLVILEKMSQNGYIDNQMIKSVMDNTHQGSLINWAKSF